MVYYVQCKKDWCTYKDGNQYYERGAVSVIYSAKKCRRALCPHSLGAVYVRSRRCVSTVSALCTYSLGAVYVKSWRCVRTVSALCTHSLSAVYVQFRRCVITVQSAHRLLIAVCNRIFKMMVMVMDQTSVE